MSRAKTAEGKERWASTCAFHEWWQTMQSIGHQWPNNYEAALHAWKESAHQTRQRLRSTNDAGEKRG